MQETNDQKYKEGETVLCKDNPDEKLIIRRYVSRIYYFKFKDHPNWKELALFEREIQTLPQ